MHVPVNSFTTGVSHMGLLSCAVCGIVGPCSKAVLDLASTPGLGCSNSCCSPGVVRRSLNRAVQHCKTERRRQTSRTQACAPALYVGSRALSRAHTCRITSRIRAMLVLKYGFRFCMIVASTVLLRSADLGSPRRAYRTRAFAPILCADHRLSLKRPRVAGFVHQRSRNQTWIFAALSFACLGSPRRAPRTKPSLRHNVSGRCFSLSSARVWNHP